MKRLKQLLVIGLAAVMVFAFSACGGGSSSGGDTTTKTLSSISVVATAAQTEFYVYEDFSSDGIVVTANYSDESTETLTSSQYTVDYSAYSAATAAGTYTITVSYEGMTASYDVTAVAGTVSSFSVDAADAKTLYYLNQGFDSTGLIATAIINGDTVDVSSRVTVDSGSFVGSTAGEYSMLVTFNYCGKRNYGTYTVTVTDQVPMAGLDILVDGDIPIEIDVPVTGDSVTLSTDLISGVQLHEILYGQGTVTTPLSSSDYTVKFYNESNIETVLTGDALTVSNGTYILVVEYAGYVDPAYGVIYTLTSHIIIHIVNPVTAIALDETNTSAVYTQAAGSDKISSTWTYTITYSNGTTATVSADDVTVTIDTKTVSESSTATVSYTLDGVTVTCTVPYSITEATGVTYNYSMSISELVTAIETRTSTSIADKTQLAKSDFTGSNAFLTLLVEQSSNQYRTNAGGVIESKGESLSVTFYGTGTISITYASTGSGNVSSLALIDEDGNYVTGVIGSTTATTAAVQTDKGYYYNVTNSDTYVTVTFTVSVAGTYIIATNIDTTQNRGARISSIVMVDET